ncbi:MAG: EF-hand domain-containing protein [Gemmataceae bacterium]|nr:EF-hand domain-containing protein [Gemmataceae bacterium]
MARIYLATVSLLLAAAALTFGQDGVRERKKEFKKKFDPAQMLKQFDKNNDGVLEANELPDRMRERFAQMDANGDGKLNRAELEKLAGRFGQPGAAATPGDALFRLLDANGDGKLSKDERNNAAKALEKALERLDRNKDGMIDRDELSPPPKKKGGRPGEVITPAAKGERIADKLKVGDPAPDFTLPLVNGKGEVKLSSFQGKKPVVLIFASYT